MENISKVAHDIILMARYGMPKASKVTSSTFKVKDVQAEINRQVKMRSEREVNKFKIPSVRGLIWEGRRKDANMIAEHHIPRSNHAMGCLRRVSIPRIGVIGCHDSRESYPRGYKYTATHGDLTLKLSAKQFVALIKNADRRFCYTMCPRYYQIGRDTTISVTRRVTDSIQEISYIRYGEFKIINDVSIANGYLYNDVYIFNVDNDAAAIDAVNRFIADKVRRILTNK